MIYFHCYITIPSENNRGYKNAKMKRNGLKILGTQNYGKCFLILIRLKMQPQKQKKRELLIIQIQSRSNLQDNIET